MQIIDRAHIERLIALPDGADRILAWVCRLIEERDEAQAIAAAVVRDAKREVKP